jgi:hypothetical protein
MRDFLNRNNEQFALIRRDDGTSNTRLAIFVHGFRGNYLTTWGKMSVSPRSHEIERCGRLS